MDATPPFPDAPLPDDVASLQALVRQLLAEVAKLRAENAALRGKLDSALKHRFGRRFERRPKRREPKADDDLTSARYEHGRATLPEHLPRLDIVCDLTEAEKRCPCCGSPRACIGEQADEQLDLESAKSFVLRTTRKCCAWRNCDPTAGPEQVGPIAKGLCGPGLLAHTITVRFADPTPLHRLAGQLARSGRCGRSRGRTASSQRMTTSNA